MHIIFDQSLFHIVYNTKRSWSIRDSGQRSEAARSVHVSGRSGTSALCGRLECRHSDVRREWRHHRAGVLRQSSEIRFPSFVVHFAPVTNIVHITRRSAGHQGAEAAQSIVTQPVDDGAAQRECIRRRRHQSQGPPRFRRITHLNRYLQNSIITYVFFISQGGSVECTDEAGKVKHHHNDNPFIEPVHGQTVVDMKGEEFWTVRKLTL